MGMAASGGPIVVGFDATPQSEDALALGRLLAGVSGERLVLARVFPIVFAEPGRRRRSF